MSGDSADKTEEPTAKRESKFREEGQIAQSRDIAGVAVLTGATIVGLAVMPIAYRQITDFLQVCGDAIASIGHSDPRVELHQALLAMLQIFAWLAGPFLAVCFVLAIVAGVAQTGGNFAEKGLRLRFDFLDLSQALSRIFGSGQGLQQLLLAVGKTVALGIAVYAIIVPHFDQLAYYLGLSLPAVISRFYALNLRLIATALLGAAALAAADYWVIHRRLHEQMKMTKQEVKDEYKQMEGNPEIKRKIRARMARIGQNRMLAQVAKSSVVVVNPTHYAVALMYRPGLDAAPLLIAKGQDALAFKIRELARKNHVPVVANPPVARTLFRLGKVGQTIPLELFDAVARVLAYLYRMRGEQVSN